MTYCPEDLPFNDFYDEYITVYKALPKCKIICSNKMNKHNVNESVGTNYKHCFHVKVNGNID